MAAVLTPKELARAIGVSESSVKRWADRGALAATRTLGGHRRIPVASAIEFIRQTQTPLVRPDVLGLEDIQAAPVSASDTREAFHASLVDGDARRARGLILARYLEGESLATLFDDVVRGALEEIGRIWRTEPRGIWLEHRATDICLQIVMQIRGLAAPVESDSRALGCAVSGDPYLLPSMMAAAVLETEGFRATNLGPDMPIDCFEGHLEEDPPRLAWISFSVIRDRGAKTEQLSRLIERLPRFGTQLVLGGRAVRSLQLPSSPHVYFADKLSELAALARGRGHRSRA